MIPCIFLGDSIAVGIGQQRPECETVAKVGITSQRFADNMMIHATAATAVISLGVNDDETVPTVENLRRVRGEISAQRVFWIVPNIKPFAREAVQRVAGENGDMLLDLQHYRAMMAGDRVHPTGTGYVTIARDLVESSEWRSGGSFTYTAQANGAAGLPPVALPPVALPPSRPAVTVNGSALNGGYEEVASAPEEGSRHGWFRPTTRGGHAVAREAAARRTLAHEEYVSRRGGGRMARAEPVIRTQSGWRVQPAVIHTMPVEHAGERAGVHRREATPAREQRAEPRPTMQNSAAHAAAAPQITLPVPPRIPQKVTIFRTLRDWKASHPPSNRS